MHDPLLVAARTALGFTAACMAVVSGGSLLTVPLVLAWRDEVLLRVAGPGAPHEAILAVIAVLVLTCIGALLGFYFLRHLFRIVATVGEGDPFVPVNARRLQAMGWIAVAVHVLIVPLASLAKWLQKTTEHFDANVSISLGGLLLALVLFVLARVFREGTRLREELEGTV